MNFEKLKKLNMDEKKCGRLTIVWGTIAVILMVIYIVLYYKESAQATTFLCSFFVFHSFTCWYGLKQMKCIKNERRFIMSTLDNFMRENGVRRNDYSVLYDKKQNCYYIIILSHTRVECRPLDIKLKTFVSEMCKVSNESINVKLN